MSEEAIVDNDGTPINENHDDLDAFEADFFGNKHPYKETVEEKEEGVEANDDDTLEEEVPSEEDDDLATDNEEDEGEKAPKETKPKSRYQERIDQLSEKARIERERADALEARLAKLEQSKDPQAEAPKETKPTSSEPNPDDFALGEFDPEYQRAYIKHLHEEALASQAEAKKEADARAAAEAEWNERQSLWNEKLEPAQERYPDFHERGEELLEAFVDLDPSYGEFLTSTIMDMEHGPDVLYYLASNIEEASRITKLGPVAATLALGRIEAKFGDANTEKPQARPKQTKAPPPPPRNKGTQVSVAEVSDDTDDLEAFEAKFFKGYRK